jgi:hypothetical protein
MKPRSILATVLTLGSPMVVAAMACVADAPVTNPKPGPGTIGQPCFDNGTCNAGLTCVSNVCVDLDAGAGDASIADSPSDQGADQSIPADAADASAVYSALSDMTKWSSFDMTTVQAQANGFFGGAFDGRYVYFAPLISTAGFSGRIGRYDTQATFNTIPSWATFDTTTVNASATGFFGAAFDGRYVYFTPGKTSGSLVTRYDTQAAFGTGSSWATYDTVTVTAGANGFVGSVFDGRYVYFVPFNNTGGPDGIVARYDTQATFTAGASWSSFDTTTVSAGANGFEGAVFDGRYVYLVPNSNGGGPDGIVTRYDTQATFTTGASWATFGVTTVNANATGFSGAGFDGRYVYFVPYNNGGFDGVVARYDTQATFTTAASWSTFDVATVNAGSVGFRSAAFDGRYMYFVPSYNTTFDGLVTRYDTLAGFTTTTSWTTFDMTTVNAGAQGFAGAVFDGRYVYFVPNRNSVDKDGLVLRFDAKTPSSLPSGYAHGSFL